MSSFNTANNTILLADDHALMRRGLADHLQRSGHQVIAQAEDFNQLKTLVKDCEAKVVVCDCRMPGDGPVNFLFYLTQYRPDLKVIFLSGLDSAVLFSQLLSMGAHALVSKKSDINDIISALEAVEQGQTFISPTIEQSLATAPDMLTAKEFQVFELIVEGHSNTEIAEKLHRSASTVNTHRVSLMQKLDIHSVVDLIHFARKNGLYEN
ncbi:MAG: response regulator transcription factor [Psychrosphaera sp.]|nr:response regulator transcription factor [Psychrosphaera sp.]